MALPLFGGFLLGSALSPGGLLSPRRRRDYYEDESPREERRERRGRRERKYYNPDTESQSLFSRSPSKRRGEDLSRYKLSELREYAREHNLKGHSRYRAKAELIEFIKSH